MRATTVLVIAIIAPIGYLMVAGEIDKRDQRIAELERQASTVDACRPIHEGEIAAMSMRGGEIQCAVTSRVGGVRRVVRSM